MKLVFAELAWEDYLHWQQQDRKMVDRINKLIRETQREPFSGIGKPEPLKHQGFRSYAFTINHRRHRHQAPRSPAVLPETHRMSPPAIAWS